MRKTTMDIKKESIKASGSTTALVRVLKKIK